MPLEGFKTVTLDERTLKELEKIGAEEGTLKNPETVRLLVRLWKQVKRLLPDVDWQPSKLDTSKIAPELLKRLKSELLADK